MIFQKNITFQILEIYKGPENLPNTIKAKLPHEYITWGPHLETGQAGEYMFTHDSDGEWQYAGPGACAYLSEEAWIKLRKDAIKPRILFEGGNCGDNGMEKC